MSCSTTRATRSYCGAAADPRRGGGGSPPRGRVWAAGPWPLECRPLFGVVRCCPVRQHDHDQEDTMGSVIKKRRKRMAKKKHRKLLRKTRHQRRNKK
ncbi:hypothetical protein GCM10027517_37750 [Phycicoccus ginsengisoli]